MWGTRDCKNHKGINESLSKDNVKISGQEESVLPFTRNRQGGYQRGQ